MSDIRISLVQGFLATAVTLSATSVIADDGGNLDDDIPAGCYNLTTATITENSVDAAHVVGKYRFVLKSMSTPRQRTYVITGPLSGSEDAGEGARRMAAVRAKAATSPTAEGEGPHGGHNLGTDNMVGTMSTEGDSIEITDVSCPNGSGIPQIIKGVETFTFTKGTGIFTKIASGRASFNLTYNACNNRNNAVARLELIQGQLCFR